MLSQQNKMNTMQLTLSDFVPLPCQSAGYCASSGLTFPPSRIYVFHIITYTAIIFPII